MVLTELLPRHSNPVSDGDIAWLATSNAIGRV